MCSISANQHFSYFFEKHPPTFRFFPRKINGIKVSSFNSNMRAFATAWFSMNILSAGFGTYLVRKSINKLNNQLKCHQTNYYIEIEPLLVETFLLLLESSKSGQWKWNACESHPVWHQWPFDSRVETPPLCCFLYVRCAFEEELALRSDKKWKLAFYSGQQMLHFRRKKVSKIGTSADLNLAPKRFRKR